MLRVTSLGKVVASPGFYTFHQRKPALYPIGYVVEVNVFGKVEADEQVVCIADNASTSSASPFVPSMTSRVTTSVEDLFLIISITADNEEHPMFPMFCVVRSDDDKKVDERRVFTSPKSPNKAIRNALESIEIDYPSYKDKIRCSRDAKGVLTPYGPRFIGVSLKPVQQALLQLPLGPLAFRDAEQSSRSMRNASLSSAISAGGVTAVVVDEVEEQNIPSGASSRGSSQRRISKTTTASSHATVVKNARGSGAPLSGRNSSKEEVVIDSSSPISMSNTGVCPDCGESGTPFCATTGEPHVLPPLCPLCHLQSAYCPMTGKPHPGVAIREGRKRGEVLLPHPPSSRKKKKMDPVVSTPRTAPTPMNSVAPTAKAPKKTVLSGTTAAATATVKRSINKKSKVEAEKAVVVEVEDEEKGDEKGGSLTIFDLFAEGGRKYTTTDIPEREMKKKNVPIEKSAKKQLTTTKILAKTNGATENTVVLVDDRVGKKRLAKQREHGEVVPKKETVVKGRAAGKLPSSSTKKNPAVDRNDVSLLTFLDQQSQKTEKPLAEVVQPPEVRTLRPPLASVEHSRANLLLSQKIKRKFQTTAPTPVLLPSQALLSPEEKLSGDSTNECGEGGKDIAKENISSSLPTFSVKETVNPMRSNSKRDSTATTLTATEMPILPTSCIPAPFKDELRLSLVAVPARRCAVSSPRGRGRGGGRQGRGEGSKENEEWQGKEEGKEGEGNGASPSEQLSPSCASIASFPSKGPQLVHPLDIPPHDATVVKRFISFSLQHASEKSKIEALRTSQRSCLPSSSSTNTSSRFPTRKKSENVVKILKMEPGNVSVVPEESLQESSNDKVNKEDGLKERELPVKDNTSGATSDDNILMTIIPKPEIASTQLHFS